MNKPWQIIDIAARPTMTRDPKGFPQILDLLDEFYRLTRDGQRQALDHLRALVAEKGGAA